MDHHYFKISGMGVDQDPRGVFTIDKRSGVVKVHKPIDREVHKFFHVSLYQCQWQKYRVWNISFRPTLLPAFSLVFVFLVADEQIRFDVIDERNNIAVDKTLAFDVAIKDINDNAPRFEPANIRVSVSENTKQGKCPSALAFLLPLARFELPPRFYKYKWKSKEK